jgi:hypothetical protein
MRKHAILIPAQSNLLADPMQDSRDLYLRGIFESLRRVRCPKTHV